MTEQGSGSYVSPVNVVKVPVWVVRVSGGLLILLGAGAAASIVLALAWTALLTTAVGNQGQEQRRMRVQLNRAVEEAVENQKKLDQTLGELESIRKVLESRSKENQ